MGVTETGHSPRPSVEAAQRMEGKVIKLTSTAEVGRALERKSCLVRNMRRRGNYLPHLPEGGNQTHTSGMRTSLSRWLELYGESHRDRANQIIHKICVPSIFWAVVALLWAVPLGPVRLVVPVSMLALAFYFRLSVKAGFFMLAQIMVMAGIAAWVEWGTGRLVPVAIVVFVLAWIGQFIGHHIEGKKPSFFEDLQFLLIGPLWVFRKVF